VTGIPATEGLRTTSGGLEVRQPSIHCRGLPQVPAAGRWHSDQSEKILAARISCDRDSGYRRAQDNVRRLGGEGAEHSLSGSAPGSGRGKMALGPARKIFAARIGCDRDSGYRRAQDSSGGLDATEASMRCRGLAQIPARGRWHPKNLGCQDKL
jgi:hypothetical protein